MPAVPGDVRTAGQPGVRLITVSRADRNIRMGKDIHITRAMVQGRQGMHRSRMVHMDMVHMDMVRRRILTGAK